MGRKEPGPYNPGKTWPGEAHKQPQLATQYYRRAIDEERLRIRPGLEDQKILEYERAKEQREREREAELEKLAAEKEAETKDTNE